MGTLKIGIVGGGIVGVSTALWLQRDGHDVTLFDRTDPGSPDQTSYGNAGMIANCGIIPPNTPGLVSKIPKMLLDPMGPLHLKWLYLPRLLPWLIPFLRRANREDMKKAATALAHLLGDATEQHAALHAGTPAEAYFRRSDYVMLYKSRKDFEGDALSHGLRQEHGNRLEEWERPHLEAFDPQVGPHYAFAAVYANNGWLTDPGAYVAALFEVFLQGGGAFRQGEVADIHPRGGGAEVVIQGATLAFDRVVLSGGVWSDRLARKLGHRTALEDERGYHLVFENPSLVPPVPYSLADAKFIATPMNAGIRCAGQVEFGGLDAGPSEGPFRLVHAYMKKLYPALEWQGEARWLGHRPSTIDSLPLIGPSPRAPAILFAFGAQHIGMTSGPKTGRLIADFVADRTPNIDMIPFRVGRFD